ncbi:MAG: precorrin-6y C5,15-methyltransferase (decarboxylating) subunit CbiE [Planctomycetota bacterium]
MTEITRRHRPSVHVVGIDGRGCAGLTSEAMHVATRAQVLAGGERHLAFFPQYTGQRVVLRGRLTDVLDEIAALAGENDVCILASGDPLFFGVASLVLKRFGPEHVDVVPTVSSMQLAFARAHVPWNDAALLSLHGRPLAGIVTRLRTVARAGVFTDELNSPSRIAAHLLEYGERDWRAIVAEDIGTADERVRRFDSLDALARTDDIGPLNVLVLERTDPRFAPAPSLPFLDEAEFAKKMPRAGLITKREVRALALAQLRIAQDAVVWDVGAGSGSVSVEASFLAPRGRVFAVEVDAECAGYCRENARAHGADSVTVVEGAAPDALYDLPAPDAVFVGGTKGSMAETLAACASALRDGGRLVVSAITLENVAAAHAAFQDLGLEPEMTLLQVSRGAKLARYLRYEALNPIHLFAATVDEGDGR